MNRPEVPRAVPRAVPALARFVAWLFYRLERTGDAVPEGPVLLVANHPNALLDPSLVWATAGRDIRFLAKSTLFAGNVLAPLIRRSGAIPVYRRTDDGSDLSKNAVMFAAVGAALSQGDAVCLFPEGKSHSSGRLEELRTGAARIALAAAADGVPLKIVPIGLNLNRKAVFRSRATALYGRPFAVDDLLDLYAADQVAAVKALTERIAERLRALIIEADPRSDAQLVERVERLYATARGVPADPRERIERSQIIARGVERLRSADPARYEAIRERVRAYDALIARFGLRDRDIGHAVGMWTAARFALRELVLAALLLPVVVGGAILHLIPYLVTDSVVRVSRPSFDVRATMKALAGGVFYALWYAALATFAWLFIDPWLGGAVVLLMPLLAIATLFAVEREWAVARAVRAYLAARRLPRPVHNRLKRSRAEIAQVLEQVYDWLNAEAPQ